MQRASLMNNKKGQILGLGIAKGFVLGLLTLLVIGVAVIIVLKQLGSTSIVSADNDTQNVIANGTSGLTSFFSNTGTWLVLVGLVILMIILFVVIRVVAGSGGGKGGQ